MTDKEKVQAATVRDGLIAIAKSERRKWDEPPAVYFVYHNENGYRFNDLGLPQNTRKKFRRPGDLLRAMAELYSGLSLYRLAPDDIIGVAFRDEANMVKMNPSDEVERNRTLAMAGKRQLFKHPQCEEVRLVLAITKDGTEAVHLVRSTGEFLKLPAGAKLAGDVQDALEELASAIVPEMAERSR